MTIRFAVKENRSVMSAAVGSPLNEVQPEVGRVGHRPLPRSGYRVSAAEDFPQHQNPELRDPDHVSTPHGAGLADEPVHPFESEHTHPPGGTWASTREEFDAAADEDDKRNAKPVPVTMEPVILLRTAEPDEEDIRCCRGDRVERGAVVHRRAPVMRRER